LESGPEVVPLAPVAVALRDVLPAAELLVPEDVDVAWGSVDSDGVDTCVVEATWLAVDVAVLGALSVAIAVTPDALPVVAVGLATDEPDPQAASSRQAPTTQSRAIIFNMSIGEFLFCCSPRGVGPRPPDGCISITGNVRRYDGVPPSAIFWYTAIWQARAERPDWEAGDVAEPAATCRRNPRGPA
jgi:hypothetical protein